MSMNEQFWLQKNNTIIKFMDPAPIIMKEDQYEVQSILAQKFCPKRNRIFYLVKWKNWKILDSNWQPQENLAKSQDAIEQFHKKTTKPYNWQRHKIFRQFWQKKQKPKRGSRKTKRITKKQHSNVIEISQQSQSQPQISAYSAKTNSLPSSHKNSSIASSIKNEKQRNQSVLSRNSNCPQGRVKQQQWEQEQQENKQKQRQDQQWYQQHLAQMSRRRQEDKQRKLQQARVFELQHQQQDQFLSQKPHNADPDQYIIIQQQQQSNNADLKIQPPPLPSNPPTSSDHITITGACRNPLNHNQIFYFLYDSNKNIQYPQHQTEVKRKYLKQQRQFLRAKVVFRPERLNG